MLPGVADYAKTFFIHWIRLSHAGRYDLTRFKAAMLLRIANDAPLRPEWLNHALKGDRADHRERHTDGEFLLIYQLEANWINLI